MFKVGDQIKIEITSKVVGSYDVVVCGGGTAGCVAAIAAAREGAKVAIIEASAFLGGMLTEGNAGLTNYVSHGKDPETQTKITERLRKDPKTAQVVGGIPLEFANKLIERGAAIGTAKTAGTYVYTDSQEFKIFLFETIYGLGIDVFLHSPICATVVEGSNIVGVATQTKLGQRVYLGKHFIDATGDGDVAALSGVPFTLGVGVDDSVYKSGKMKLGDQQAMGAMFRIGGVDFDKYLKYIKSHPDEYRATRAGQMTLEQFTRSYNEGDMINSQGYTGTKWFQIYNYPHKGIMVGCISLPERYTAGAGNYVNRNGLEVNDLTVCEYYSMLEAKKQVESLKENVPGFENAFVLDTPRVGVRETRHIEGEYRLNIIDIMNRVKFPDAIGKGSHPIDVGPLPDEVKDFVMPEEWSFDIPYRCMIPKNISNLLVAGKCVSATREGYGCIRPTVQCMVLGEAAGTAAAILCRNNISDVRNIDVEKLRATLMKNGAIV